MSPVNTTAVLYPLDELPGSVFDDEAGHDHVGAILCGSSA